MTLPTACSGYGEPVRANNYEVAASYLLEARRRFGEQDILAPLLYWAHEGMAHAQQTMGAVLKSEYYGAKCLATADTSIVQGCSEVAKKFPERTQVKVKLF